VVGDRGLAGERDGDAVLGLGVVERLEDQLQGGLRRGECLSRRKGNDLGVPEPRCGVQRRALTLSTEPVDPAPT
jgi:hypothetical protein